MRVMGVYLSEKLKTDTIDPLGAWEQSSSRLCGLDQCDGYRNSSRISPYRQRLFGPDFNFEVAMFIKSFCSPVSRNATDRKDQDLAHGAVSSSSEFLSLTLFVRNR